MNNRPLHSDNLTGFLSFFNTNSKPAVDSANILNIAVENEPELKTDQSIKSEHLATITHDKIAAATQNAHAFLELFANLDDLQYATDTYPERNDDLFHALILNASREPASGERFCNEGFMRYSDDFVRLAAIFPHKKAELFALIMQRQNLDEFFSYSDCTLNKFTEVYHDANMQQQLYEKLGLHTRDGFLKLIFNLNDLSKYARAFPLHHHQLLGPILQDSALHARFIEAYYDILKLGSAFPNYHAEILDSALGNPAERLTLISGRTQLVELGRAFPYYQGKLIHYLLANPTDYTRIVTSLYDLRELNGAFPAYPAALLDPLLQNPVLRRKLINSDEDLIDLLRIFPTCPAKLVCTFVIDLSEYKRIVASRSRLVGLSIAFTAYHAALLNPLLTNADERSRLINDSDDLIALGKAFPMQHDSLLKPELRNTARRTLMLKDSRALAAIGAAYPDYQAELIEPVLNDPLEYARLRKNKHSVQAFGKAFPAYHAALLKPVLSDSDEYLRVVTSQSDLFMLGLAFPNHHAELLKPLLSNPAEYRRIIKDQYDLPQLGLVFVDFHAELLNPLLLDPAERTRLIQNGHDLQELGKTFPVQKSSLIETVLKDPAAREQYIKDADDLVKLGITFPENQATLIKPVIDNLTEYKRFVTSRASLISLANVFPEHHDALLQPVLHDHEFRDQIIAVCDDMATLGIAFPEHQTALLHPVLQDSNLRLRVINYSNDVVKLCAAFPNHRASLLNSVLASLNEYARVLKNITKLQKVCDAFPDALNTIFKPIANNAELRARFITSANDLIKLAKMFPAHAVELFESVLQDPALRSRCMNKYNDLVDLNAVFPKECVHLLNAVLLDPTEYARVISDTDILVQLCAAYPDQNAAILRPILKFATLRIRFLKDYNSVCMLAKGFPTYSSTIINLVLNDSAVYQQIVTGQYALVQLGIAFPAHHGGILRRLLTNPAERTRIIKDADDVSNLGLAFSKFKAALITFALADTASFKRLLESRQQVQKLGDTFPAHRAAILEPVLCDAEVRTRIILNSWDLAQLGEAFPAQQSRLLAPVLASAAERIRLITNGRDMSYLAGTYRSHQMELASLILTDLNELRRVCGSRESFDYVMTSFRKHRTALLALTLNDETLLRQIVRSISDIEYLCKEMPTQRRKIADWILASKPGTFRQTLALPEDIFKFVALFPDCLERTYARIVAIGLVEYGMFLDFKSLDTLVNSFPAHIDEIFNCLFNEANTFEQLVNKDSSALIILMKIFPLQRQKMLLLAAKRTPEIVMFALRHITESRAGTNIVAVCIEELEENSAGVKSAKAEFQRLEAAVIASNKMLTAFQQRSFSQLFTAYMPRIIHLMIIMGPAQALALLATIASISVMQLEQFLKTDPELKSRLLIEFLRAILTKFAATLANKNMLNLWRGILSLMTAMDTLNSNTNRDLMTVKLKQVEAKLADASLADTLNLLSQFADTFKIELLGLSVAANEIDPIKLSSLTGSRFWLDLISGRKINSMYQRWQNAMLLCDITHRSLDSVLHETQRADANTRGIAEHNSNIRGALVAAGIDPDKAINYKRTHTFSVTEKPKIQIDWQALAQRMLAKLETLKFALEESKLITDQHIRGLYNAINKVIKQLTKGNDWQNQLGVRIQTQGIENLLRSVQAKMPSLNDISSDYITEVNDSIVAYMNNRERNFTRGFRAEQWDKANPTTSYLGDYLDCCIGVNGSEALAMIERRLDDAMPIHVVIDEATNEPVCGIWLFWAIDANDNKLKLVANYIELNHSCADSAILKNSLICNLIYFTGELYLNDVVNANTNKPELVMRPLTYGNIAQFTAFGVSDCRFTSKLGGFCRTPDGGPTFYYLKALECEKFHLYSLKGLREQYPDILLETANVAASTVKATLFAPRLGKPSATVTAANARLTCSTHQ